MKPTDDTPRDALGLPYTPRPLPPQPARSLLNGLHKWRSSADTDVAATIRRARKEQAIRNRVARSAAAPVQLLTFKERSNGK